MSIALMLAVLIAGPVDEHAAAATKSEVAPVQILEPLSCSQQGDKIVCVFQAPPPELQAKPAPDFSLLVPATKPHAPPYKPTPREADRQAPEVFAELRAADADITRAQDLLRRGGDDLQTVLAQQMLYYAQERKRMALTRVQVRKPSAEDPFEQDPDATDSAAPGMDADYAAWLLVCGTPDAADECREAARGRWWMNAGRP